MSICSSGHRAETHKMSRSGAEWASLDFLTTGIPSLKLHDNFYGKAALSDAKHILDESFLEFQLFREICEAKKLPSKPYFFLSSYFRLFLCEPELVFPVLSRFTL